MPDPRHVPDEMEVSKSRGLTIVWRDGRRCFYPIHLLRVKCPCAVCREERSDANPLRVINEATVTPGALTLLEAKEVGAYALGFRFSDGHSTGIYHFQYLREICPEA